MLHLTNDIISGSAAQYERMQQAEAGGRVRDLMSALANVDEIERRRLSGTLPEETEFLVVPDPDDRERLAIEREQRIDALPAGFADADQQPRGHRDPKFAGGAQRLEPPQRQLVRRTEMRSPLGAQALGRALQHQAHRCAHRAQAGERRAVHDSRVQMWQQPRLLEHQPRDALQVLQRAGGTRGIERPARRGIAQFRLITQRE